MLFRSSPFSVLRLTAALLICAVTAMAGPGNFFPIHSTAFAQQTSVPFTRGPIAFPTNIQWGKQRGVTKYRLQIADDEKFSNIFYDGPVMGERYTVTGLAPGYYYWRIAPSDRQTGAFLRPARFFVSGGVVISVMPAGSPVTRSRFPGAPASRFVRKG